MRELTTTLRLSRAARVGGTVRYERTIEGEKKPFVLYVPLFYCSQANEMPVPFVRVTIIPEA